MTLREATMTGTIEAIAPDEIKSIPTFRAAYSDRTALLMAKLSYRAYVPFDADDNAFGSFRDDLESLGLRECDKLVDPDVGTAGFVVAGDDLIVVVFRGTENELDWRSNVRATWVVLQGGVRVHRGFFQAYWPIRERLFATVEKLLKVKPRPVYITGHSLGGALATMATAELANHPEQNLSDSIAACYTFGSPRVGDRSFDEYVKVPLYRVTNGVDLVPAVPFAFLGYRHVGDTRHFAKLGSAPSRRSPSVFAKIWRTLGGMIALWWTLQIRNVADHSMTAYIDKLSSWAKQNLAEIEARRAETRRPGDFSRTVGAFRLQWPLGKARRLQARRQYA
jgi:triacylglycerol lipase